jgi:hypothetical protein
MAKSATGQFESAKGPNVRDKQAFKDWLAKRPPQWSVTIASRAALRVFPVLFKPRDSEDVLLSAFRAIATARLSAKFPKRVTERATSAWFESAQLPPAIAFAVAAALNLSDSNDPDVASFAAAASTAAAAAAFAASEAAGDVSSMFAATKRDVDQLQGGLMTPENLAALPLWLVPSPPHIGGAWLGTAAQLRSRGEHWSIWTDWYDDVVTGAPRIVTSEAQDAAHADALLPWEAGAEAVNLEISRQLADLSAPLEIPEQSLAPVRVEEREGKVSQTTERDSDLTATERDFCAWRDPVLDHIDELTTSDFAAGTNHGRVRNRLVSLGRLLPGEIVEVKDRQFRIGYEIERFEGLMAAYRAGGEDMPVLNVAQLEDLDRLRIVLKMGLDKLDRWSQFRKLAGESAAGESNADREVVADTLAEVATVMERRPQYFDPQLPASFRFLEEAVRDPSGATTTVVYGAVKSVENLLGFLGQRALGIGRKGVEAVETHISKAVAASLVLGLGGAALKLSGALPQGWAWLKPLLAALGSAG